MSRFIRPSTTTLTISNGDTLTVKTRLTHGERSDSYERQYEHKDGQLILKPGQIKLSLVTAYLVDWTLTDDRGERAVIFMQPIDVVERIVRSLSPEDFMEIAEAISAHERAQLEESEQKKRDAASTSASPSGAAGLLSGSAS